MLSNEKNNLITDVTWFAKVIQEFSNSKLKSSDYKELKSSIGTDVPIQNLDTFKELLSKEISIEKVYSYLSNCNIISFKLIFNLN